ncbi:major facilitator superfamily domain-containing protein [Naematelia encephala]|uniref:Major facilitator superfamily domain-containing protein n=1 Tax=Naematelia encephala TaxID=71784 RepID=A0A1Y2AWR8_9TREE|nr:major facilitator superfamily domain-containing protein [Naematelia encephala]
MVFSKWQLAVLLSARVVEPIGYTILFPFVNTMMEDLLPHVPKASIGKYSGAIESIFALSSVVFMYQWGKLSDKVGRKPVILGGLCGMSLSLFMFGLSKSFWWAMGARVMSGALCGNASVMRAVLGEMTTKETEGWVYPLWSICWDLSCIVGPALGAMLESPARQYPHSWLGNRRLLRTYPYLLPCAFVSGMALVAAVLVLFCLKETLQKKKSEDISNSIPHETTRLLPEEPIDPVGPLPSEHTFKELISIKPVQQVLISIFLLSLCAMSFDAGFVLFAYSSTTLGGIALSPMNIARCLSIKGALSIIISLSLFPLAQRKFGTKPLYRFFATCWIGVYALPPMMNALASGTSGSKWVLDGSLRELWYLMVPMLMLYVLGDLAFPLNMMALNAAAPSQNSLGALNGISLITSALSRSIGPAMIGTLYGVSAKQKFPLVWFIFGGTAVLTALQSCRVEGRSEQEKQDTKQADNP